MREEAIFYYAYSFLVGGVCLVLLPGGLAAEALVVGILVLACLLGGCLLLQLSGKFRPLLAVLLACAIFGPLWFYGGGVLPLAVVLGVWLAEYLAPRQGGLLLSAGGALLLELILQPPLQAALLAPLCMAPVYFLLWLAKRLAASHELLVKRGEEQELLRAQLGSQRRLASAMENAARLSERNRLAARIHDQVGHGISGSILLLEGARLNLQKNPGQARQALADATENLRCAVDDIRASLREERSSRGEVGLSALAAALSRFEAQHPGIKTELKTEGELGEIPPLVWLCAEENLTEALTNLLKHSSASRFTVLVAQQNKLTKICFKDNGAAGPYKPGLGLAAMEERCALCHGHCVVESAPAGFTVRMTFTQPREGTGGLP